MPRPERQSLSASQAAKPLVMQIRRRKGFIVRKLLESIDWTPEFCESLQSEQ